MQLTPEERDKLIRTLYGEAATDPESQEAVVHVIKNRVVKSGADPVTVVTAPKQFEPWQSRAAELNALKPDDPIYQGLGKVVDKVWTGKEPDPTGGATLFYSPTTQAKLGRDAPKWDTGEGQDIGQHRFFKGNFPTPKAGQIVAGLGPQQVSAVPAAESAVSSPPDDSVEAPASEPTKSGKVPNLSALFADDPESGKLLAMELARSGVPPAHIKIITGIDVQ